MKNTIQVAADRARDQTKTVLPAEVARGLMIEHPPSAQALKLLHLMVAVAAGRMAEDRAHEISGGDIRRISGMRKHDRTSLVSLFSEIRATTIIFDDVESKRVTVGGFLDEAKVDYRYEDKGDIKARWWFSKTFRRMAEDSNHWAIMDRQTIFALSSKYSILLFQHIASLTALDHITSRTFTVKELRAVCGVPDKKLERFADLRRFVIERAIAEINQLSRLTLTATPNKIGRTVASVEISWEPKPDPAGARRELDRPKVGRKARREGTGETPIVAFPAAGSIRYTDPWERLALENCNWDHGKIADAFRSFCRERNIKLDANRIERLFRNFCVKQSKI